MKRKRPINTPIMKDMCPTCPFRDGSKTEFLRADITMSALTEVSRICHSTGSNNAFHRRTGKPQHLCRGARDVQLRYFCAVGIIKEPTDKAWQDACERFGITTKK